MEKIKIILMTLLLVAPSLLISKDCGDEPIKPEKKENQNQLAYALSSEYLIWLKDYEIWKNCKQKTQESNLDEKISSDENESNEKEADCGNKPIYTGSKFGTYRNSKEYKEFKTRLIKWEECNNKKNKIKIDGIDFNSETSIRNYFDKNGSDLIEGIWEYASAGEPNNSYRMVILKKDYYYQAIIIEKSGRFNVGDMKAKLETAASDEVLTINWTMGDKITTLKTIGTIKNNALIEFNLNYSEVILYRIYPKFDKKNKKRRIKNGDWAANGSGIIISKSGYIVTNHHVIDDADDIEVEFILDEEIQKFNAEIVQSDKINDLAILKIVDINFDGLKSITYNFKTRSSDVGTKVFAYGYPFALSGMGKEIKVTDGIISSKTGFDGDITRYQISAAIQGGNSGGPLFDSNGNLIGINSAKIQAKEIDNVGYSIKTSYVLNLIDILPKNIELPSSSKVSKLTLTEQVKEISKYVVLVKVK